MVSVNLPGDWFRRPASEILSDFCLPSKLPSGGSNHVVDMDLILFLLFTFEGEFQDSYFTRIPSRRLSKADQSQNVRNSSLNQAEYIQGGNSIWQLLLEPKLISRNLFACQHSHGHLEATHPEF